MVRLQRSRASKRTINKLWIVDRGLGTPLLSNLPFLDSRAGSSPDCELLPRLAAFESSNMWLRFSPEESIPGDKARQRHGFRRR